MNLDPKKSAFDRTPARRKPLDRMRKWLEPALKVSDQPLDPDLERRLRRPMVTGAILIGVFVLGFLGWAVLAPLDSAVIAPGVVRVEENRKVLRHREGGIVRAILVREGEKVKKGQVLLTMDDVQPRAAVDVMQNQVDTYAAQVARFDAEATGAWPRRPRAGPDFITVRRNNCAPTRMITPTHTACHTSATTCGHSTGDCAACASIAKGELTGNTTLAVSTQVPGRANA